MGVKRGVGDVKGLRAGDLSEASGHPGSYRARRLIFSIFLFIERRAAFLNRNSLSGPMACR